jgi:hypothetical protein
MKLNDTLLPLKEKELTEKSDQEENDDDEEEEEEE